MRFELPSNPIASWKMKPTFIQKREIPQEFFGWVEKQLHSLEETGVVKIETSDWGSLLVILPKADRGAPIAWLLSQFKLTIY